MKGAFSFFRVDCQNKMTENFRPVFISLILSLSILMTRCSDSTPLTGFNDGATAIREAGGNDDTAMMFEYREETESVQLQPQIAVQDLDSTLNEYLRATDALLDRLKAEGTALQFSNFFIMELFESHGFNSSVRMVQDEPTGLRMLARFPIKKGDIVYKIEWDGILSLLALSEGDRGLMGLKQMETLPLVPSEVLTMHLLRQGGNKHSIWRDYIQTIDAMKREPLTATIAWNANELAELQASSALELTKQARQSIEERFEFLTENLFKNSPKHFNPRYFTKEMWMKFHTIVESRSFGSNDPMEPTGGGYGYVLYTDAFRHSKDGCRIRWNAELFQIIASKDYSPGEEVFLDMGWSTVGAPGNQQLLVLYGSIAADNPNTQVLLRFKAGFDSLAVGEILEERVVELLPKDSIQKSNDTRKPFLVEMWLGKLNGPWNLLSLARMVTATPGDLQSVKRDTHWNGEFLTIQNELRAVKRAIRIIEQRLSSYRTRKETDESILGVKDTPLPRRYKLAVSLRKEEKEILILNREQLRDHWAIILKESNV